MAGSAELLVLILLAQDPREALERLDDPDPRARVDAQKALLAGPPRALEVLRNHRNSTQNDVRFRVDLLIATLDAETPKGKAEDLLPAYWARAAKGREETIRLLGAAGAAAALTEIAKGESDVNLRVRVVWALRVVRREENEKLFADLLKDESRDLRAEALIALAELGKCGVDRLRDAARDVDPRMHRAVTMSLRSLPEKDVAELAGELLSAPAPALRAAGVDALRRLKVVARSEDLGALIGDPDRLVRRKALDALLEMDGDAPAAALGRLSTVNNHEDRRRLVASLERTASLKPIPILLERLKRLEEKKRSPTPRDINPEREDAVHVLGRLASRLGAPQPRPAPLAPAAVRLRAVPEDPAAGTVLDGSWGKSPAWAHRRGTALFLDFGEARTVHSIVALKDGGWPLLYASEDELAYAWCAKLGPSWLSEHVLVDVKARHLKIEHSRTSQDDGRVRELFVYTMKGEGVLAAWEAWWKALEPRLAGYAEARPLVVEARATAKDDPEASLAKAVELVKKHPGLYVSYQVRAEARLRTGDVEGAIEDARRGLALAPEAVGLRAIEAEAHLLARRWDEARAAADQGLAEAPGDPRAHAAAARARAGKGEKVPALEDLLRAVLCGFDDRAGLEADALLAPLRVEKRFAEILELLR